MDNFEDDTNDTANEERNKCVSHFWKSASNSPEISELTIRTAGGIKTVALGSEHSIFLGFDGQVYARGANNCGQLGQGDFVNRDEFCAIPYLAKKKVVDVDCGSRHSAALTSEGTVYCWGDTSSGQCGVGDMKTVSAPAKLHFYDSSGRDTFSLITQVACGELHSLGLTSEGHVWAWGSGSPIGLGNAMERALTPKKVEDFVGKKVLSVACGSYHSMAIVDADGIHDKGKESKLVGKDSVDRGQNKNTSFSSRLRIPGRNKRNDIRIERSSSVPLPRKTGNSSMYSGYSDTSSESDGEGKRRSSPRSERPLKPEDIPVSVVEDGTVSGSSMASTIDTGITKLTNAVMHSMSGVLSLTSSLTGQTSLTDRETISKKETNQTKTQPKVKTETYEPVCVQVWTWGRGTCGQLGHGTTEDRWGTLGFWPC